MFVKGSRIPSGISKHFLCVILSPLTYAVKLNVAKATENDAPECFKIPLFYVYFFPVNSRNLNSIIYMMHGIVASFLASENIFSTGSKQTHPAWPELNLY